MTIDITLSPIYRIGGQEIHSLPGLIALTPPQTPARGRERDRLIAYLLLTGNSTFSTSEYMQVAADAAKVFGKGRQATLACDLTTKQEKVYRGTLGEITVRTENKKAEFMLVIHTYESMR